MKKIKDFLLSLKSSPKKIVIFLCLIIVILFGWFLVDRIADKETKQIYEVLIRARDKKNSLKTGDVLLTQVEGRKWSKTERVSYLILKMNLTPTQAMKLTEEVLQNKSKSEIEEELKEYTEAQENITEDDLERYEEMLKQETEVVQPRKYRINMEKYFPDFKPTDLIKGQPFDGEIFGWEIVEEQ